MSARPDRKQVVILGSTGSIGTSTLSVIEALPERFSVLGLAASSSVEALQRQIDQFRPRYAACGAMNDALRDVAVVDGPDKLSKLATLDDADIVVVATTGHDAIQPTIDALRAGKIVALANKESVVAAGEIVMREAREGSGSLRPVDSEHSALWQCLMASDGQANAVEKLILTASGGPFRGWTTDQLKHVTLEQALKHPNWEMGQKITIDSATMMNKGLEIIEAHWLFGIILDRIHVVIHKQSLIHSCVEFVDGATVAQFASHDMRVPIQYALTYPERVAGNATRVSILEIPRLDFERPDDQTFPLLNVCRDAAARGSTWPAVLSAADDVAVSAFLQGRIRFDQIADVVQWTLDAHPGSTGALTVEGVREASTWAASVARRRVESLTR